MKRRRMPIVTVTAYDAPGGRLAEQSGVDIILVCDGQVLVYHDLLGLLDWAPRFAKRYAD